ncbi:Phosphotidylinositol phosphatase PTPRQ-like protein, partial [Dinothrombium tinctorium]
SEVTTTEDNKTTDPVEETTTEGDKTTTHVEETTEEGDKTTASEVTTTEDNKTTDPVEETTKDKTTTLVKEAEDNKTIKTPVEETTSEGDKTKTSQSVATTEFQTFSTKSEILSTLNASVSTPSNEIIIVSSTELFASPISQTTVLTTTTASVFPESYEKPFVKKQDIKIGNLEAIVSKRSPDKINVNYTLNSDKLNTILKKRGKRDVSSAEKQNQNDGLKTHIKLTLRSGNIEYPRSDSVTFDSNNTQFTRSYNFVNLNPKLDYKIDFEIDYISNIDELKGGDRFVLTPSLNLDLMKANEAVKPKPKQSRLELIIGISVAITVLIIVIAVLFIRRSTKSKHKVNNGKMKNGDYFDNRVTTDRDSLNMREFPRSGVDNEAFSQLDANRDNNKFSYTSYSQPIDLSDFIKTINELRANNNEKLLNEFQQVKRISDTKILLKATQRTARMPENRVKNRFANIIPCMSLKISNFLFILLFISIDDHSRVKLIGTKQVAGSDYINANFISGFNGDKEYIATQGPLKKTLNDFWRMIIEQNVQIIINLTLSVEGDVIKCETYWPSLSANGSENDVEQNATKPMLNVGAYRVVLNSETIKDEFVIREMEVFSGDQSFLVRQYHLVQWPDFESPRNPNILINLVKAVRSYINSRRASNTFSGSPILVHCSAGVGRTGTFIAVDRIYQELLYRKPSKIDIFGTVLDMRQYRNHMVQTEDQYIYIYDCVAQLVEELVPNSSRDK